MSLRCAGVAVVALAITLATVASASADDRQRIRDLDAAWVKGIAERNAAWIADLYAPDGRLMAPNAPLVSGRDAVRDAWKKMLATPGFALTFTPKDIEVSPDGHLAYEVGSWRQPGKEGVPVDEGKYVLVWKKIDGDWKVVADIFNSDRPGR